MPPDILSLILSIPLGMLSSLTYDKLKAFAAAKKAGKQENAFAAAFLETLGEHKAGKDDLVKTLHKAIKEDKTRWLQQLEISESDFDRAIDERSSGLFYENLAAAIAARFLPANLAGDRAERRILYFLHISRRKLLADLVKESPGPLVNLVGRENTARLKSAAQKQIKILALTASPEDGAGLNYEMEQDTLLEAFKDFDRMDVFLDMPDPVKSTLAEIEENLGSDYHDILLISAHGGVDEKGEGYLALEDGSGHEEKVTGKELAGVLRKAAYPPHIVILSACHTADSKAGLMPVAQALFEAKIDTVIGMKSIISHEAAIAFCVGFFSGVLRNRTVVESFAEGREAVAKREQEMLKENPNWKFRDEANIPELLYRNEKLTRKDFHDWLIESPGPPQSHRFLGAKYRERGFIGRRQVLRRIYGMVEERVGAIVLKGPGGIGKSTLTTRVAAQLHTRGYDFIVIQGQTSPEGILHKISLRLLDNKQKFSEGPGNPFSKGFPGRRRQGDLVDSVYSSVEMDIKEKLSWYMDNYLGGEKVVFIFDNFEENQAVGAEQADGEFTSKGLKEFLWFFRDSLKGKAPVLLFSSRYSMPGFEGQTVGVGEFSELEYRKMMWNGKALGRLGGKELEELRQEIGGNPRAIELLDSIAWLEFEGRQFGWPELRGLFPGFRRRMIEEASGSDPFAPLFLNKLFSYLTQSQGQALQALSIFRSAVDKQALAALGCSLEMDDRRRLTALSLLEYRPVGEMYYVHRLTAQYALDHLAEDIAKTYHSQAAEYFHSIKDDEGKKNISDGIEARWHYLQAGEWDRAADITFSLYSYLTLHGFPQQSFDLLQELVDKPLSEENRAICIHTLGILYQQFGQYEQALEKYQESKIISEKRGDEKGIAVSLHQIGMIYEERGEYDAALDQYKASLEIAEKIGDIAGVSKSLHQIGNVYYRRGEYDAALEQYQKALEIKEKIGDKAGKAKSLHQIGVIYEERGDYDAALEQYQASLEIKEKIGDIAGAAKSLHQIGMIYEARGEYDSALEQYKASLEIAEKIGDIAGKAASLHQIGMIYELRGEYDAALEQYKASLEIKEKIGDIAGAAKSLHQIGMIYEDRGEYDAALEHYQASLEIDEKIGNTKGVAESLHQIGTIYELRGEFDAALDQYQASLEIKEKIGDIAGVAISLGQIGAVHREKGNYETALKMCLQSLMIFKKIGSPNAEIVKGFIARIQEKMSKKKFEALMKKVIGH